MCDNLKTDGQNRSAVHLTPSRYQKNLRHEQLKPFAMHVYNLDICVRL